MDIEKLKNVLGDQPKFRFKQAGKAIFVDLIENWNDNTTLPKNLQEVLNNTCPLDIDAEIFDSKHSDTIKALITLEDQNKIETVLMKHKDGRATVCVSSQVGCALACQFCATGKLGYKRNLTVSEILIQVLLWQRMLKENKEAQSRVTNIVYMGMGEPFLNYENVIESIKMINDKDVFNIGARSISISTSGIIPQINKFAKEKMQINLAISLHAPNDELRSELMPINNKYPLTKLMPAIADYVAARSRQVMFEYLMIDGVNDQEIHAKQLAELVNHPLYMVNLIRYNPTGKFKPSNPQTIKKFKNILMRAGVKTTQRQSFGTDIKAACGQLAGKNNEK